MDGGNEGQPLGRGGWWLGDCVWGELLVISQLKSKSNNHVINDISFSC